MSQAFFDKPRHIKFWKRCSTLLPEEYTTGDGARMSLGFFIVAALDLLDVLETTLSETERRGWIDWVYSCQLSTGGFRGFPGTNLGDFRSSENRQWDPANLPNTFLALLVLLMLGDDLERVKRQECLKWLKTLQRENGSFGEFLGQGEKIEGRDDLRQCYCAAGISFVLQDGMDDFPKPIFDEVKLRAYIRSCQNYEGGYGQAPAREPHSGMNFCANAALSCLNRLHQKQHSGNSMEEDRDIEWTLNRQTTWVENNDDSGDDEDEVDNADTNNTRRNSTQANGFQGLEPIAVEPGIIIGFNGRCGKLADTCYCFWNAGALAILQHHSLVEDQAMKNYLVEKTQHVIGGFGKVPGARPDLMHSYLGLAALALYHDQELKSFDATLCISSEATSKLNYVFWRKEQKK